MGGGGRSIPNRDRWDAMGRIMFQYVSRIDEMAWPRAPRFTGPSRSTMISSHEQNVPF